MPSQYGRRSWSQNRINRLSQGATVTLIDCDPNRPIVDWKAGPSASKVRIIGDVTESTVISVIQEEAKTRQFVIVDLEGTASRLVSRAIARASFADPLRSRHSGRKAIVGRKATIDYHLAATNSQQ